MNGCSGKPGGCSRTIHLLCMFAGMTTKEADRYITGQLSGIYDPGEASSMAHWIMEHVTGKRNTDRIAEKEKSLGEEQIEKIHSIVNRLLKHEPLQYVLNESWFCGLKFYVDNNVLIPRPETEELVEWIISDVKFPVDTLKILDIGTGSGCIAISLKRRIRKAEVWACDISEPALEVAKKNAQTLGVALHFLPLDFLDRSGWPKLPRFHIIVSNPPYVPAKDKGSMEQHVLDHEPATALFVPDNDPLIFYQALAEFGKSHLLKSGKIYMEIHESLGKATRSLFQSAGYSTELRKDMQQKDRMLRSGLVE